MPKLAIPLTEKQVIGLQPKLTSYKTGDGRGLYLVVEPTGKKRWRMIYKRLGRGTTLSFGSYPEISLAVARHERDKAHRLLAKGIDPIERRRENVKQKREASAKLPKIQNFRLSMNIDGSMIIENASSRMTLKTSQVSALRAFMIATNDETQGE